MEIEKLANMKNMTYPGGSGSASSFKVFYELMKKRISEILLVSSPYDAFIMEEDGRLAESIIHEYRGLNLTRPPRLTWVSTAQEAFNLLSQKQFDLVITMPHIEDVDPYIFCCEIKKNFPKLPVFLLSHGRQNILADPRYLDCKNIDKIFIWTGNTDLLLAMIKSWEDRMNVARDTKKADVRVIVVVEDSAIYYSSLLPILYKVIVLQTQAVMEDSLNEEDRILRMRARPKILLAENFEEAENLYRLFKPYLLGVLSDIRFPRNQEMDPEAGFSLLSMIKKESPDTFLLNFSSEESNRQRAEKIPAVFLNKNSPSLHSDIDAVFTHYLGFGDFVFRLPDEKEIARVSNLRAMEKILPTIPDESINYHAARNHFSTWLMARSEIQLASKLRPIRATDFPNVRELRELLILNLKERRKFRQRGVVTDFINGTFDPETDFLKVGKGSLGGKARGLAFVTTQLKENPNLQAKFPAIDIIVPKSFVISTEGFDSFIVENNLQDMSGINDQDAVIAKRFLKSRFSDWMIHHLKSFLKLIKYPLAVRSSSLLEDAQFQPFAGVYKTYMVPNNHPDLTVRLNQLMDAIRLVYASIYFKTPRSYAKSTLHRIEDEKMAVVIQQLIGSSHGDYFYPAISGVIQSYNFYPIAHLKSEEGIAHIALGLGKTVMEGANSLRFSPKYPEFLPQFSTVDDILKNSQRFFYALKLTDVPEKLGSSYTESAGRTLAHLEIDDFLNHTPVKQLSSTYIPEEHRIRDTAQGKGYRVLTFASILKYKSIPLPEILSDILDMGRKGMGSPVEIEFAVNLATEQRQKPQFALLQIRPMALNQQNMEVVITEKEIADAFCFSTMALGNGIFHDIADILYVKPDSFDPAHTTEIALEIGKVNRQIINQNRKYILIGPGRWGSADRWLGIPVKWNDISGIGAIIEARSDKLHAEPSQGTHFFQNITSLGISYITISKNKRDFIDWDRLNSLPFESETAYLKHIRLETPLTIKIDGKKSWSVLLK